MGFLDQAKDMYKLQRDAKKIKKELANIHVEAESDGVVVVVNGEQEVLEVRIPEALGSDHARIAKAVVTATNKAIKESQRIGAEKMQSVMGGLGGMFGGK